MKISIVSPYHGGSHQAWAEGYRQYSQHEVTLNTLPDRFWKWRMHGGAITLARRFRKKAKVPDMILATDMLDLTTFLALTRPETSHIPTVLYMHENQLTYPLPQDKSSGPMRRQLGERDHHYVFINYASMLAADLILFNSRYHHDSWFKALPKFLKHFPEYNEMGTVPKLQEKSRVLPVGINFKRLANKQPMAKDEQRPSLILWNQRWEYDKNPEAFFAALYAIADDGYIFEVALCGQQYGKRPSIFTEALERLGSRIIHSGHATPAQYRQLLWAADITLSTAHHEFFGISILEAIYCRTFPILPYRLSYPELIPETLHYRCLYENQGGLVQRLKWALDNRTAAGEMSRALATAVQTYDWQHLARQYDTLFNTLL